MKEPDMKENEHHIKAILDGILTISYPKIRLEDVALEEGLRPQVEQIIVEHQQRDGLRKQGRWPIRKISLIGPPGTGKTMTAAAIASELKMGLVTIQLDGLITEYKGERVIEEIDIKSTRRLFDVIKQIRGVYLFDEYDAFGVKRVEIRRMVNSLLQFVALDESDSLIICATNDVPLLGRPLLSHFDAVLEYPMPSKEVAIKIMRDRLEPFDTTEIDWSEAAAVSESLNHAEIASVCERVARIAIVGSTTKLQNDVLVIALKTLKQRIKAMGR